MTDNTMAKKDKERSTKHYTENKRTSNMNPSNNRGFKSGDTDRVAPVTYPVHNKWWNFYIFLPSILKLLQSQETADEFAL